MNRTFGRIAMILILIMVWHLPEARSGSQIIGTVRTQDKAVLPFANVFLKETFEGTTSDENGFFKFATSATGTVTLVCSFIGYQKMTRSLALKPGETMTIGFVLESEPLTTQPVLVTASAFTAADAEGVTLSALDVVRTPGAAADLFWAIKTFPGLQQVEEGAGLFVRGGDVSETAILLDGAYIQHPYKYESPTGGYFGTFSPFLLKGTYFASGGFSAQYGNALSGALAMESHDLPERRRIGISIGLAAESAFLSLPLISDRLGLSFSANRSNARLLFELNQAQKSFSQYPVSYDLNLNTVYKINSASQLKLFLYQARDKVGVEVDDPDYQATHFYGNSGNRFLNLKYSTMIGKNLRIEAITTAANFSHELALAVLNLEIQDRLYQSRFLTEAELRPGLKLYSGLEFYRFQTLISGQVPQDELDLNPMAPADRVNTDYRSDRSAQFVQLEGSGYMGVQISAGLRGEYETISGQYRLAPRLTLSYPLTTFSSFSLAWGRYQQYPEPSYYDPAVGNPDLTAMQSYHYILGYAYQKENRIFRLEGYYKRYLDLILNDSVSNYNNQGHGYALGVDIFVKNSCGPLSGWLAYSWLQARRKWQDQPVLAPPYFDITHNLTLVVNLDLPRRFSIGSSYRFATGKPYTPAPGKYHQARVPDYHKIDLTLSYISSFFNSNMTIFYLSISNLSNRINIFDYRYSRDFQRRDPVESSMGRTYYFGVSINME